MKMMMNKLKTIVLAFALCMPLVMQGVFTRMTHAQHGEKTIVVLHDNGLDSIKTESGKRMYALGSRFMQQKGIETFLNSLEKSSVSAYRAESARFLSITSQAYFMDTWKRSAVCFNLLLKKFPNKDLNDLSFAIEGGDFKKFDAQARALWFFASYLTNKKKLTIVCIPESQGEFLVDYLVKTIKVSNDAPIVYDSNNAIISTNFIPRMIRQKIPTAICDKAVVSMPKVIGTAGFVTIVGAIALSFFC